MILSSKMSRSTALNFNRTNAKELLQVICNAYYDTFDQTNPAHAYPRRVGRNILFYNFSNFSQDGANVDGYLTPKLSVLPLLHPKHNGGCTNVLVAVIDTNYKLNYVFATTDTLPAVSDELLNLAAGTLSKEAFEVNKEFKLCEDNGYCLYIATTYALEYLANCAKANADELHVVYLHHKNGNHYDVYFPTTAFVNNQNAQRTFPADKVYNITSASLLENELADDHLLTPSLDNSEYLSLYYYDMPDSVANRGLAADFKQQPKIMFKLPMFFIKKDADFSLARQIKSARFGNQEVLNPFTAVKDEDDAKKVSKWLREQVAQPFLDLLRRILPNANLSINRKLSMTHTCKISDVEAYLQSLDLAFSDNNDELPKAFGFCALTSIQLSKKTKIAGTTLKECNSAAEVVAKIQEAQATKSASITFYFDTSEKTQSIMLVCNNVLTISLTNDDERRQLKERPLFYEWLPLLELSPENEAFVKTNVANDAYREHEPSLEDHDNNVLAPLVQLADNDALPAAFADYNQAHFVNNASSLTRDQSSTVYKMQYNYADPPETKTFRLLCSKPTLIYKNANFGLYKVMPEPKLFNNILTNAKTQNRILSTLGKEEAIYLTWSYGKTFSSNAGGGSAAATAAPKQKTTIELIALLEDNIKANGISNLSAELWKSRKTPYGTYNITYRPQPDAEFTVDVEPLASSDFINNQIQALEPHFDVLNSFEKFKIPPYAFNNEDDCFVIMQRSVTPLPLCDLNVDLGQNIARQFLMYVSLNILRDNLIYGHCTPYDFGLRYDKKPAAKRLCTW